MKTLGGLLDENAPYEVEAQSWSEAAPILTPPPTTESLEPQFTLPPVSGFWRRLLAFSLDGLLLGAVGQALGWSLSPLWFRVGPYGRFVGFLAALVYFGVLDSRIGGGQTLGKRLLKVAVRNAAGEPIGVGRSILRTLIWLVPVILNGWALPIMSNVAVSWIAGVILFGVGGAVVLTMVFNRKSRQGIHDLFTKTYVVHLTGLPIETLPVAGRLPWILAGTALALILLIGVVAGAITSRFQAPLREMIEVQQKLQADGRFFSASIMDQTFYESSGDTSHALRVQVWYKGKPTEAEYGAVIEDVAGVALTLEDVDRFDLVRVDVMSAYDLGFAKGWVTFGDGQTVTTWRERLGD